PYGSEATSVGPTQGQHAHQAVTAGVTRAEVIGEQEVVAHPRVGGDRVPEVPAQACTGRHIATRVVGEAEGLTVAHGVALQADAAHHVGVQGRLGQVELDRGLPAV